MPETLRRKREWQVKEDTDEVSISALMEMQNGEWVELGALSGNESFHDQYYRTEWKTHPIELGDPTLPIPQPETIEVKFEPTVKFEPEVRVTPEIIFTPSVSFDLSRTVLVSIALLCFIAMFFASLIAVLIVKVAS